LTPYLDTSLVVAAISGESRTDDMQAWLGERAEGVLLTSVWTTAEVSAALSVKRRTAHLSSTQHANVLATFRLLTTMVFDVVEVTTSDFMAAARFADRHDTGLRAGDALHIAIAERHGATIHTLDRDLARAAKALGVAAVLL
jgi:predicted nucleic acid-binding protein